MIQRVFYPVLLAVLLSACGKDKPAAEAPPPAEPDSATITLHFQAVAGLNPGADGQAAPVRVRLYELKNSATFSRADYFALADRAQATLGVDLLDQDEVLIRPGQSLDIRRTLTPATRQLGLVVGYREIDQARWRTVISVLPRQTTEYTISLDVRALQSTPTPAQ
ncbi:type VI secretion system lipoprotein TssJ [Pseudomonas sp. Pseusp122]|uniref:type VI secretion system lipoprotein TssJ n=1 Tax=unclassified Pseudomonas TaxID=196821 RepID=UPI0039A607AB